MKALFLSSAAAILLTLIACSQMPKECNESWEKIESLAKQMGLSEDQIKTQKKEFETNIKNMNKDEAVKSCQMQSAFLGLAGK